MNMRIGISVRTLVEFIMRHGDIASSQFSSKRAVEGTKAHKRVQKMMGSEYTAEYSVQEIVACEEFDLVIRGRIDGLIQTDEGFTIDEIKSTAQQLESIEADYNELHWAQAMVYAYIIAKQEAQHHIKIQLTYINIHDDEIKRFERERSIEELEVFFSNLVTQYYPWAKRQYTWNLQKIKSIEELSFPFKAFRKGQKRLLSSVYRTILEKKRLFMRAPTGTGKTMGTIYPTLKALQEANSTAQVFYLTAKTIGRDVAENAFLLLRENGLAFKTVTLTAKDKICFQDKCECEPELCPYAKGHYDRINDAIWDLLHNEHQYTRGIIEAYAMQHQVCPFEMALDLTDYADGIICDYNYAFDPRVMLKRFFGEGIAQREYIFLVDEAHNLVDRAREMYSANLYLSKFEAIRKEVRGQDKKLTKYLGQGIKFLKQRKQILENEQIMHMADKEYPDEIIQILRGINSRIELILSEGYFSGDRDILLEFYFEIFDFVKKSEFYDEHFITYDSIENKNYYLRLYCQDPSKILKDIFDKAVGTVIFSATLIPLHYYVNVLGGDTHLDYGLELESPFDEEKQCLMIHNKISTKYRDRVDTYDQVTQIMKEAVIAHQGNYLFYFPSYHYMNEIHQRFIKNLSADIDIVLQQQDMTEKDKEEFLFKFNKNNVKSLVGFAVLGGVFGEGIDLVGNRLVGVVVVGVGLPGISYERDLIKAFYGEDGYSYAYIYPGMNKVLQAVGRVIRTEEDRGVILLIDSRLGTNTYQQIFPKEWSSSRYVATIKDIRDSLTAFWG